MNIFVYSDESGVLDKVHNDYFVFGGVVFLSKDDRDIAGRKYIHAENCVRGSGKYDENMELKASKIGAKEKRKLYRSLNGVYKFGVVIEQADVLDSIMNDKKSKQRFLDYAFKIGVKRLFQKMIQCGEIVPDDVENIYFFVDEHTTSTNGIYELRESLEEEFKRGTFNRKYTVFYAPLFNNLQSLQVKYCNSTTVALVRAADIVANRIYHDVVAGVPNVPFDVDSSKLNVVKLPMEQSLT